MDMTCTDSEEIKNRVEIVMRQTDYEKEIAEQKAKNDNSNVDDVMNQLSNDLPIKRLGKPSEFGPIVAFLCSEKSSYITGNSIQVDGGLIKSLF